MSQDMEYTSRRDHTGQLYAKTIVEQRGQRTYWQALQVRSSFLRTLNKNVLHVLVEEVRAIMSSTTMVQLRVLGGAMGRVNTDATAFAHRANRR